MYQQIFVYATPDRKDFRYVGQPEPIEQLPSVTYGSTLEIQLPIDEAPRKYVVAHLPFLQRQKEEENDLVPKLKLYLASFDEWHLYEDFDIDEMPGREIF